ncbi:hypothetical protein PLESTB_001273800 [Pleodorina starrii]|uniref:Ankyrin repeat domain-containing protein n=1 Tax=Pleodorina starrii TaxID=330485 RepID=A0A9W6BUP8_9CHLO|nr:hypothetical protein PLESTM_002020200 [Pleodorina starrii]GLC57846.1 hypothetical protein PLESTB_001273800 [Pleodorina starrii]GLC75993.1 hypothetical protein PLESTF_001715600 [Pleodorina starrii]
MEDAWSNPFLHGYIAALVPANEIACSVRRINRLIAARFKNHKAVSLSKPCPCDVFQRRWAAPGSVRNLNFKQRIKLVCLTAASGVIANLEVAFKSAGCLPAGEMMKAAAAASQLSSCQWLRQQGCPWGNALAAAARAGHANLCKWMLAEGCPWSAEVAYAAIRGGHVSLMRRLLRHRPDRQESTGIKFPQLLEAYAEGCDLATFQKLHAEFLQRRAGRAAAPVVRRAVLAAAARSPTPDWRAKVEWLEAQGYPRAAVAAADAVAATATTAAAADGHERLTWLRQRGYPLLAPRDAAATKQTLQAIGRDGDVALLQYLLSELPPAQRRAHAGDIAEAAAGAGRLEVLRELLRHPAVEGAGGLRADADAARRLVRAAAEGGHLAVVAWAAEEELRDLLCSSRFPGPLLNEAALSGCVELLDWVWARLQRGQTADSNNNNGRGSGGGGRGGRGAGEGGGGRGAGRGGGGGGGGGGGRGGARCWCLLNEAATAGCEAALDWAAERGLVSTEFPQLAYARAGRNGDLVTVRWLHARLPGQVPSGLAAGLARMDVPPPVIRLLLGEANSPAAPPASGGGTERDASNDSGLGLGPGRQQQQHQLLAGVRRAAGLARRAVRVALGTVRGAARSVGGGVATAVGGCFAGASRGGGGERDGAAHWLRASPPQWLRLLQHEEEGGGEGEQGPAA